MTVLIVTVMNTKMHPRKKQVPTPLDCPELGAEYIPQFSSCMHWMSACTQCSTTSTIERHECMHRCRNRFFTPACMQPLLSVILRAHIVDNTYTFMILHVYLSQYNYIILLVSLGWNPIENHPCMQVMHGRAS